MRLPCDRLGRRTVVAGEQYEPRGFSFSRFAASGAHLAGRKIISAEAWTWLGIPNRLADSLADFKLAIVHIPFEHTKFGTTTAQ